MTNANRFIQKRGFGFGKSNYVPVYNPTPARVSVGFETGSRYMRRSKSDTGATSAVKKKAYISPDATVLLMPDAIDNVAIDELFSATEEPEKKQRVSLREKIRNAAHRESLSYTMYGVDTRELFTQEIETDVIGATALLGAPGVENEASAAEDGEFSSSRTAAAMAIEKFKDSAEIKIKSFASRLGSLLPGTKNDRRGA